MSTSNLITLATAPDAESRSLLLRAGDLRARFLLLDIAEEAYSDGLRMEAARALHACDYLADRLQYELYPPPSKSMIRIFEVPNG